MNQNLLDRARSEKNELAIIVTVKATNILKFTATGIVVGVVMGFLELLFERCGEYFSYQSAEMYQFPSMWRYTAFLGFAVR